MKRITLPAVAATAACLIGLEITLTRIYAVVLWYHFAFLAVSVCLFGMGAAGIALHGIGNRLDAATTTRDLARLALGFALSAAAAILVLLRVRLGSLSFAPGVLVRLAIVYFLSAVPFFFGGGFLALAIRRFPEQVGRVYFADLAGASLGCLSVVPLLSVVGAPTAVFFYAAVAAVVAFALARMDGRPAFARAALGVAAVFLVVTVVAPWKGLLQVRYSKGNVEPERLLERWNSFSRVIAFPREYVEAGRTVKDVMLEIDGVAHTPISPFNGDPKASWFSTFDLSALPFAIKPGADLLIFGSGGGEHIITALPSRPKHITGVEMNPIVVDLARREFGKLSGGILDLPNVSVVVDEGRSFLARTKDRYDVIQFTLVDTWASTVAGGYVLTENNVFTRGAFALYFDRLKPGGLLTLKRWYKADGKSVEEYTLRLVSLTRDVLAERGERDFSDKYFVAGYSEFANLIVKPSGFTLDEVSALLDFCRDHGLDVLYSPFYEMPPGTFHELIEARDPENFLAAYPYDLSPVTDNRPFFFYTLRARDLPKVLSLSYAAKVRNIGPLILLGTLGLALAAVLAFALLPALAGKRMTAVGGRGEALKFAAYFALIGTGFLLIEVALMQRFILFLGHPVYSLAVILFSILLFGGVGSFFAGKVPLPRLRRTLAGTLIFLILYVGAFLAVSPKLFADWIAHGDAARIAIAIALLAPVGLAMGTPFPSGVRILAESDESLIPWMWAINSGASVLGSVLAMVLAVHFGFAATIAVGLACYLVVAFLV